MLTNYRALAPLVLLSRFHLHVRLLFFFFFFSSRRRHTRSDRDWSSDVCSSDLPRLVIDERQARLRERLPHVELSVDRQGRGAAGVQAVCVYVIRAEIELLDRKSVV